MATALKIDLEQLAATVQVYETSIEDLDDAFKKADEAMAALQESDWSSGASAAFFSQYDNSWKQNMKRQQDISAHLHECLSYALQEYEDLYSQVSLIGKALG